MAQHRSSTFTSIGTVRSTRKIPDDDHWDAETSAVELDPSLFGPESLQGLADFTHVEILFHMDQVNPGKVERKARRPRNNPSWPEIGIFAQRAKNRPNPIGLTICKILGIDGLCLRLQGLDAIDGTPVLDIKPWVKEFGPRGPVSQPLWVTELMTGYWS